MRVLHVVASGQRRGAEIFTADLVGALNEAGVDQRVAVLRGDGGLAVAFGTATAVLEGEGRTVPGLRVGTRPVRELRRIIRAWDPDVVQAHGGEALKYAALGPIGFGGRLVYRRIGSTPPSIARGPRRIAYGRLMRRAARVVAVAEAVREETIQIFGLPDRHVVTIPNAVDARRLATTQDRGAVRRALGIPADAEVILSLGALTWEKDPLLHIRVAADVLAERPGAWHLIAGDGPMRAQVAEAVTTCGQRDRVRLLGTRGDVGDLLAASDVVLFASCSEGMPATVIEAGIAGVPVAGYAVAGVSEVVESGRTGLLAPPGDPERLLAHVADLLADGRRRLAMGIAARERCLAFFDIRAVAPRYLELYGELTPAA
jgi:glycosyltransferase involved in cell wall biosynthesis